MESITSTVTRSAPSKDCFLLSCLRSVSSFSSTDSRLEISEAKQKENSFQSIVLYGCHRLSFTDSSNSKQYYC